MPDIKVNDVLDGVICDLANSQASRDKSLKEVLKEL